MTIARIRWRLNDPAEDNRVRWTKVHHVSVHNADLTVCHRIIPQAYMTDYDEQIPADAPVCTRCKELGLD